MSDVNPETLSVPENMTAAIVAKTHAENQIRLISREAHRLRRLKIAWKKRLTVCIRKIEREAVK